MRIPSLQLSSKSKSVYLHPKSSFTVNKEMKRQVYIAIVVLAAIMLLAVPFIPHHHHDNALCTVVEHCDSDNTDNDVHTGHSDDGTVCIEDCSYPNPMPTTILLIRSFRHLSVRYAGW